MSENCKHNCNDCKANCGDRKVDRTAFLVQPHETTKIGKIIGVVSGKGGVGKSMVTSMLAVAMSRKGYRVGILDADITGPSIPMAFGIHDKAAGNELGIVPARTQNGIKIMSVNLLLENEGDPVIWRGPVIAGVVKQFWTDVLWEELDYLFVDMPPGTGDVPLTVFQSIPLDGIMIVTSPQELVSMVVEKAVRMAEKMQIPVMGLVENMSYVLCPDCGKKISVFGEGHIEEIAEKHGIEKTVTLPINPNVARLCDLGEIEMVEHEFLKEFDTLL